MDRKLPENGGDDEGMARDIEGLRRLVVDTAEEKKRREKRDIPRDLFGVVSLLPRRFMGVALLVAIGFGCSAATYIWTLRNARADDDGLTLKWVVSSATSLDKRVSLVETGLAEVRGTNERNERELKELSKALARIEGKLDKALR